MEKNEITYQLRFQKDIPRFVAHCTCLLFGSIMSAVNPDRDLLHIKPDSFGKKVNPDLEFNSKENVKLREEIKNVSNILLSVEATTEEDIYLVKLDFSGHSGYVWKYRRTSFSFEFESRVTE